MDERKASCKQGTIETRGTDRYVPRAPFIFRNVTLAGIDSVNAPREVRQEACSRLARDLNLDKLEGAITKGRPPRGLPEAPSVPHAVMRGGVRGRTLVNVRR